MAERRGPVDGLTMRRDRGCSFRPVSKDLGRYDFVCI